MITNGHVDDVIGRWFYVVINLGFGCVALMLLFIVGLVCIGGVVLMRMLLGLPC